MTDREEPAEERAPESPKPGLARNLLAQVSRRTTQVEDADPVRAAVRRLRSAERAARRRQRQERRRFSAAFRRRRRNWLITGGVIVGLALFVVIGVTTPIMAVRHIEVTGAKQLEVAAVEEALTDFRGTPLALVSRVDVQGALGDFPVIERFAFELVPPSTMIVRIEERVPVIALADGDEVVLLDAAGVDLGRADAAPVGVPLGSERVTDLQSPAFVESARVVRDLPVALREQVRSVAATNALDVRFILHNGVEVFWGNREQTQRKAVVLEQMLTALEERGVTHIDVSSTEAPVFR